MQVSNALDAEAFTVRGIDTQTIVIHPSYRRPEDPPEFDPTPTVMRSRRQGSLLCEMANAAAREQFEEVERRAESGSLDFEASQADLSGLGERKLLEQGHSRVAVLYAREYERVEFECTKRAAEAATQLRDAGLLKQDDLEFRDLLRFAEMPFPSAFEKKVQSGHAQKYIDQFDEYVYEDELRTPTEEDLQPPLL